MVARRPLLAASASVPPSRSARRARSRGRRRTRPPRHGRDAPHAADARRCRSRPEAPPLKAEDQLVTTQHHAVIGGQDIRYTATAGTLILRDEDGKPQASIFFTAYTRDGVKDLGKRPITYTFNGGPGSSSVWLHLGAFGPRRVALEDEGWAPPPPYHLVDNDESLLDVTDLVFIDPVTTGYSRAIPGKDAQKFYGAQRGRRVGRASSSGSTPPASAAGRAPSSWPARATAPPAPPSSPTSSSRSTGSTSTASSCSPRSSTSRPPASRSATTFPIRSSCRPTRRPPGTTRSCRRTSRRRSSRRRSRSPSASPRASTRWP